MIDKPARSVKPPYFDGVVNPYSDPEVDFRDAYPVVKSYVPGNPTSLFANARQSGKMPIVRQQAREWITGIYTFDRSNLEFLRNFTRSLSSLKADIDDEGFSRNGLHAGFDSIRTVAGYPQQPISALPFDNSLLLEDLGLQKKMTSRQVLIAETLMEKIFSGLKLTAIRVPKMSTSGAVRNVSDSVYKLNYGLWVFSNNRWDSYLTTFMSGNTDALVRDFDACITMGTNVRWQVDTPGKVRTYWDIRDILKTSTPHKREITTKVVIDGVEYPDFAAMRTRLINQGPWTVNVMLQPFATGFMQNMFNRYPETWYPDEQNVDKLMEGRHLWVGDVSTYDQSFSKEKIDLTHACMNKFVSDRVTKLSRQLYYSAYFTRPVGDPKDGFKAAYVGDPFDYLNDQVSAGNRSGHAFTSVLAKLWKPIDTLCKFDAIGVDVIRNMDSILQGKYVCGFLNNGDDEVVWFNDESLKKRFVSYVDNIPQAEKMFDVEFEIGAVYSGKVLQKVGPTSYKGVDRIPGTFERMLCPERSIGGRMRPMWPIGILERYNSRNDHDIKEEAFRMFDFHYRADLERQYGSFHHLIELGVKSMPINVDGRSYHDRLVMDDPSKIHYKVKPEDVSEDVLELSFAKLQPEFFEEYITSNYNGLIY
nr:MAG: putative RNA-dependent RNA polymerase [Guangxi cystovirus 12]